ncbi:MAG: hypothetical protein WCF84_22300 [Anaerolineae bacterium]
MIIGILDFGEGLLSLNYLIFCAVASLGTIQIAAGHARLRGLLLFSPAFSRWFGLGLVGAAYAWFFTIQPDLFIPGLAGGELFTLFLIGFVLATLFALGFGMISCRLLQRLAAQQLDRREKIMLRDGCPAELWLPAAARAPLVLGLREADTDSLDTLSSELAAAGAAVLLCDESSAKAGAEWAERETERFTSSYVMGVGRGADRALSLAVQYPRYNAVLALAPFGRTFNARPGLRWLRETDYLTALRATWRRGEIAPTAVSSGSRIIYGDEDLLIRPSVAREMYPNVIMVAGARHLTLAAMPAVLSLAADLFELHLHPPAAVHPATAHPSAARGDAGE